MSKFDDVKKMMKLRKDAKNVQKKLKNIHIEADEDNITVTINAEQTVMAVEIRDESIPPEIRKKLEGNLVIAFNKGIKKSQSIAAENMKDILAELGGGGLGAMPNQDAA